MAISTQSNQLFSDLEIITAGTLTVTKAASSTSGSASVAHNLGFIPIHLLYLQDSGAFTHRLLPYDAVDSNGLVGISVTGYVDSTTLYVNIFTPNYAGNTSYSNERTYTIKYYILGERAN